MLTNTANRIDPAKALGQNRLGQRGGSLDSLPAGLALTQIVSGVMENWDDLERQMPWYQPPKAEREPVRQQLVQETGHKHETKEEKGKHPIGEVPEGEEGLLGEKTPPVQAVKEARATKVENATGEKAPEKTAEATAQAALNWRAPEMPKVEGQAVPASFAVPNHSAGASGFGNSWAHAAAKQGNDNIIHSE